jgi:hypothetical protein
MDVELPLYRLHSPETVNVNVLIAPEEMVAKDLNGNPNLHRFRILIIAGICSGILSRINRSSVGRISNILKIGGLPQLRLYTTML